MKLLNHVHHTALRCLDAAQTKWFWHDVMGLKVAGAVKITEDPGTKKPCNYVHIFFEMGDGNFIAFFDDPETLKPEHKFKKHPFDLHIAFEVDSLEEMFAWQKRINEMGVQCLGPVNHGFVHSIYMFDPNGINVEITVRDANHDEILAHEAEIADEILKAWTAETRTQKAEIVGLETLEARTTKFFK
jgi:catechol 2,3-dioxygenase-like lactoylglutathione lyase family enzyme